MISSSESAQNIQETIQNNVFFKNFLHKKYVQNQFYL